MSMLAQAGDEGLGGEEEDAVRAFAAAESAVGSDDGIASEGVGVGELGIVFQVFAANHSPMIRTAQKF